MPPLTVELWSDIACPWCHVGKRRFEAALARFPGRDSVQLVRRSFELDPSAPPSSDPGVSYAERLARKYATSTDRAEEMIRTMTAVAAAEGLDFHFERIRPGNTFDAHRLLHLAAERGLADEAEERLFRGYLSEGAAIGEHETLARLAVEAGLEAGEVSALLAGEAHAAGVRADEARARALGVHAVPYFLVGGRLAVSGAQPAEVLAGALQRAWAELPAGQAASSEPGGEACGPGGCA